ncbi:MFS general substrate transporter [Emericellopsis cladophorae]|uniref:MFS general substrate transporter n=1 Tax=Emericellopsis cladophorae TaxID=2686198 RepID=A0A9Q0BBK1_9HYPO|nr:MFS general substrate transporter [Emericellopsis cladophorae]KAI6778746.1 MFS general substrate transporter [Emericellopsis cladophorae]
MGAQSDSDRAHRDALDHAPGVSGFAADEETLPMSYFYSPAFIGTVLATGLGLAAAVGGFGLAAPNLGVINSDIGPSDNLAWYFFIGAAALALVGCIICAVAKNVNGLIGGTALIGIAASGQQSFSFITGELVPMKHRFAMNALMYVFCIPFAAFGPAISKSLVLHTEAGWRWCYYIMIIINFVSGLLFTLFYFPPTFEQKFTGRSKLQQLKKVDYVGIVLFAAGLFVFLLGLSWGGQQYPWASAEVIATMVIGFLALVAFACWETFAKLDEPLLPMHLFKNFKWVVACVLLGLGASIYYAMAVIWPQMVTVLYTNDGGASMYAGLLACAPTACINAGQIISGILAAPIGKTKIQLIVTVIIGGAFLGGPNEKGMATTFIIISCLAIGWVESVTLSLAGIELLDQSEIGTAVGAAGSIRSAISSLGSAVYLSVLSNRLSETIPNRVPPAAIDAGLPAVSIPGLLDGFTTGDFSAVEGLTDSILAAASRAYRYTNAEAYSTVFYTSIAFTGLAVVLSFFAPNVDDKMTGQVAVTLNKDNKVINEKGVTQHEEV